MKALRIIIAAVAILVVAGLGFAFWKSRSSAEKKHPTFYGNVDIREVNLGFRVGGRVARILKDEGDPIQAGEIVATLDGEPFRHRLELAKADLDSLKAARDIKRNGNRAEDISQAEATVAERRATLDNTEIKMVRQRELLKGRVVSNEEYDNSDMGRREASARHNSARENLHLLRAGARVEEIAQAEADVAKAEASVRTAEMDLADATLVAPENGIVMTRAVEPGTIVPAGGTALSVNLQDRVWVRAYVSEPFLGRVKTGGEVELSTDGDPKRTFHGHVGYVSPRAEFTPKSVETKDLRTALVYRFRVVVSDADETLRQGMPVTVRLAGE